MSFSRSCTWLVSLQRSCWRFQGHCTEWASLVLSLPDRLDLTISGGGKDVGSMPCTFALPCAPCGFKIRFLCSMDPLPLEGCGRIPFFSMGETPSLSFGSIQRDGSWHVRFVPMPLLWFIEKSTLQFLCSTSTHRVQSRWFTHLCELDLDPTSTHPKEGYTLISLNPLSCPHFVGRTGVELSRTIS